MAIVQCRLWGVVIKSLRLGVAGSRPRKAFGALLAFLLAAAVAIVPAAPAWAAVMGIAKFTLGVPPGGVEPGVSFGYVIRVDCTSLAQNCEDVTITDPFPTEFVYSIVPGDFVWNGGPDTVPPGGTVFPGIPAYSYSFDDVTGSFTMSIASIPAGTSDLIQVGATLPSSTTVPNGTIVPNVATVTAGNAPTASAQTDVTVHVPTVVAVRATKDWADGSAVAQSDEVSTVTLGVRNASSGASGISSMTLTDQTTGVPATDPFNYFTLTSLGDVTYPAGADQVRVSYCTLPYPQQCGAWTDGVIQTGSPLVPDAGINLATVTGVRFEFTGSTGDPIPNGATGNVAFQLTLRDTTRLDGTPIQPTSTLTLTDRTTPSITGPQGTVNGSPASDTFQIVPNIATVNLLKGWFADANGDFQPDTPPWAPAQQNWPVTASITGTNTSPFPVDTMSLREPSQFNPSSGLTYMNVDRIRLRFPSGAASATVTITCANGSVGTVTRAASATPVILTRPADFTCPAAGPDNPAMRPTSIEVVYTSPTPEAEIAIGAAAGLDVAGPLTDNAVAPDSPYTDCADATAVNTGNGSTSTVATACGQLTVVNELEPSGPGQKSVTQAEIPIDTPVAYTLRFTNDSGRALPDFHLVDPSFATEGLTDDTRPFNIVRLSSITADCGANAVVYLLIPNPSDPLNPTRIPAATATAAEFEAARGFDVASDPLPVGTVCTVTAEVYRRDGVPDGVVFSDCYMVLVGGRPGIGGDIIDSTACSPQQETAPPRSAASLQKFIEPGTVVAPTPGLSAQEATIKLGVANTGNTHLKSLSVTDWDQDGSGSDFFRGFDFVRLAGVSFPPGADLVRFDVCTTGCASGTWVTGTPTSSATPPLPAGVAAADVRGIRITFTSSDPAHDGFNLTPGTNLPAGGPCPQSSVCVVVTPRATDRDTGERVLGTYTDTASGQGVALGNLGGGFDIPPVDADLTVVEGRPGISVDKAVAGSANLAPGQIGFFDLTIRNNGTAALQDLEISDPIPAALDFIEDAVGGGPYGVQRFDVPPGTTPPGPIDFEPEYNGSGRVSRLVWYVPGRFEVGSVLILRIGVRLAAGVQAGTMVTNTMGAGSSVTDDFDCTTVPPNVIVDGDPFLPGRNCTDDARLTTLAGASITANKWVAGNAELGLYDTLREEFVPIDDPHCPRLERGGVVFTRYPCVALAYPGENFTYMARLINSGTYRAIDMRIVDMLPRLGDTGVIDPDQRGTMWDTPPTLVAPPLVNTPSDGSAVDSEVTYSTDDPPCSADLFEGRSCPPGAWSGTFDPDATGFKVQARFNAPGLTPGASIDVTWEMTTPADPGRPAEPSIAWNSFGHSELIDTPGGPTRLGAVEPHKAGIGLVFGNLQVNKEVTLEPGAELPPGDFELTYECTVTPETGEPVVVRSGTAAFGPNDPWILNGVPANATCVVYESESLGGETDHPITDPITVVVPWNTMTEPVTATINNLFHTPPPPPPPPGPKPLPVTGNGGLGATGLLGLAALLAGLALRVVVRRRRA